MHDLPPQQPQLSDWPEDRRTLKIPDVARLLEVHKATVWHWIRHGITGVRGQLVKLPATRVGHSWRVDKDGLRWFFAVCAGTDPGQQVADPEDAARCQERFLANLPRKRK